MKYTILINQKAVSDAGLADSTDLIDWAIIDYIQAFQLNEKSVSIDGHVWINLKHLISEMPMLGLKTKAAVSNRIKKIAELGLISRTYDEDGRLYCKISQYSYDITVNGGVNETDRGCYSPVNGGVNSGERGVNEGITFNKPSVNKPSKNILALTKPSGFLPPSVKEVEDYALTRKQEHGSTAMIEEARKFHDYFETGNWRDMKGNKVKNWKQKFITWQNRNDTGRANTSIKSGNGYHGGIHQKIDFNSTDW